MRCYEARQLIWPYLDSELDAKTSFEIEQHLESCSDCARVFEAEEKLERRIFSELRDGQKTDALWERVEQKMSALKWRDRLRHLRLASPLGLAACAVAVSIVVGAALWPKPHVPDLALAVEQDHREFLAGQFGPQFKGSVPAEVARRLDVRLDAGAFTQLPSSPGFKAEGSRLCFLRGVPAAWTLGYFANVPVSVVVLKQNELQHFPQMRQRLQSGEQIVCIRSGRYQFVARLVGGHVVCAIAEMKKSQLEKLVKSVQESS